jgi:hypothetical protein
MFTGNRLIKLSISLNIYRITLSLLTNWCCSCFVFAMTGFNWCYKLLQVITSYDIPGWYQMVYNNVITILIVPEIRPFPAQCNPSLCVDFWFCFCGSKPFNTWGPLLNSQTYRCPRTQKNNNCTFKQLIWKSVENILWEKTVVILDSWKNSHFTNYKNNNILITTIIINNHIRHCRNTSENIDIKDLTWKVAVYLPWIVTTNSCKKKYARKKWFVSAV